MIKATELRIGNLVLSRETDPAHLHKIECNDLGDFFEKIQDTLDPINLTEEWLERLGFIQMPMGKYENDGNWHLEAHNCMFAYDDRWPSTGQHFSYNGCTIWRPIVYIHQLQNLYFALTGEDLIIKLPA